MRSSDAPIRPGPRTPRGVRRALSIEWKLPLLITAVLAAGLAAFLAFTYFTLARRSETVVRDRFTHASRLVASEIATAIGERKAAFDSVARSPRIVDFLKLAGTNSSQSKADSAAATALLARVVGGRDSLAVLLVDTARRVLASTGKPFPPEIRVVDPESVAPTNSDDDLGAVRVSQLVTVGDRMLFWIVAPVVAQNRRLGYVLEPRWLLGSPNALRNLRELTREDLMLFSRNIDGSGWNYTPGVAIQAPSHREVTRLGVTPQRPGTGRLIVEEAPVVGTPWLIVIDSPVQTLLARLKATVERLAWWSLLLLAAGAALSWAIGRRLTTPIIALTTAADQVAMGTYERLIPVARNDEVGRLTARFHEMAGQVSEARRELERRASDAQHVADELAAANRRLQQTMTEAESARSEAERARGESEAANRAKSDFLAMMSHELRTPLNAIAGYAQLLEMGIHGPVTEQQRDAINRIVRSQAHLLTLINDVLNFARIDAGQMRYVVQDVPMHDTLAGLEPLVAPQIAARRLTYTYDACRPDIVAAADGDKVRQVVVNLLSNAVKYTPVGGTVRLACDADVATVRVHVTDTGPGIDPEQLPVIFEPFVQGHRALNRPNDGVGLGLAISRDLARGMAGDVTVTTELGVGSTFTLALPRAPLPGHPDALDARSGARAGDQAGVGGRDGAGLAPQVV
jgi:signal transduction histidine kinase